MADTCRFEIEYRGQQNTTLVIIKITRRKSCEAGGGTVELRSGLPEVNTYQQKDIYLYGPDTRIFIERTYEVESQYTLQSPRRPV